MSDHTKENQKYLEERIRELAEQGSLPLTEISWDGEKMELNFSDRPSITIRFEKLRWEQWPPTEDDKKDLKKYYTDYKASRESAFKIMETWERTIQTALGLQATQIGFISTDPELHN